MEKRKLYWRGHLRHLARIVGIVGVFITLLGCSGQTVVPSSPGQQAEPSSPAAAPLPGKVTTQVIAEGLQIPWGLAFLPDGRALVTERASGKLLIVTASGQVEEVRRLPSNSFGEGGLLGVALSPNYAVDGWVYTYYSTKTDNRIVRFRLKDANPQLILTGIPVGANHNGGRIAFGPDGMLYVGTGDAGIKDNAQNLNSLGGKILRMKPDGGVPGDNPFPNSLAYSYGHRNVQGLAWDLKGQLYAPEFGQNTRDEINRIMPGGNYGWPNVEGDKLVQGRDEPRFIEPITTFTTAEASPSGATILKKGAIPQWEGTLFVAGLRGQRLWHLTFNADGSLAGREALLEGEFGRLREIGQAPDGSLWILTSNRDGRGKPVPTDDRIIRLGL